MMSHNKPLPDEVIDAWPEIFSEVTLNVLPLEYVRTVLINFKDGKSWEIGLRDGNKRKNLRSFEQGLSEILRSYEDFIDEVDVQIDTGKVKRHVEKAVKKVLNNLNL